MWLFGGRASAEKKSAEKEENEFLRQQTEELQAKFDALRAAENREQMRLVPRSKLSETKAWFYVFCFDLVFLSPLSMLVVATLSTATASNAGGLSLLGRTQGRHKRDHPPLGALGVYLNRPRAQIGSYFCVVLFCCCTYPSAPIDDVGRAVVGHSTITV